MSFQTINNNIFNSINNETATLYSGHHSLVWSDSRVVERGYLIECHCSKFVLLINAFDWCWERANVLSLHRIHQLSRGMRMSFLLLEVKFDVFPFMEGHLSYYHTFERLLSNSFQNPFSLYPIHFSIDIFVDFFLPNLIHFITTFSHHQFIHNII